MPAFSQDGLFVLAIAANVLLAASIVVYVFRRRRDRASVGDTRDANPRMLDLVPPDGSTTTLSRPTLEASTGRGTGGPEPRDWTRPESGELRQVLAGESRSAAYDRAIRIVSWSFILTTTVIVAVSGLWSQNQTAILVTLAVAGILVLVVHDLLPARVLGSARFAVEGVAAIACLSALVLLTGRGQSPFIFVYPLLVGGVSLVVAPAVTVALAALAGVAYLSVVFIEQTGPAVTSEAVAAAGVNLAALCLLAYAGIIISREQHRTRQAAIRLSTVDSLTGLYNRAYFFTIVDREIERSSRFRRGFCLLMMDLDELKWINDRFGHFHGDRALRGVAGVVRGCLRKVDTPARYGGDEFVALLPETDPTGAYVVAEKIRQGVVELVIDAGGTLVRTSISVGVVMYPDDGTTSDELMIAADEAMYRSKRMGKNRVVGFDGPTDWSPGPPDEPPDASGSGLSGGGLTSGKLQSTESSRRSQHATALPVGTGAPIARPRRGPVGDPL